MSTLETSTRQVERSGNDQQPPLVILVGPTAVGKTRIAIQLARRLQGEIVSADSRLFYRGMDIGTAKPTLEERQGIPHHLIDIALPDQLISLAEFQHLAHRAIQEIHSRGHLPFLVGGTGQYIRAIIQAWELPHVEPNLRLRSALENWGQEIGAQNLHQKLAWLDQKAAQQIDPPNLRRTVRALEVIFSTGRLFSAQRRQNIPHYRILLLGLTQPRNILYEQIDARIEAMLTAGLVTEVKSLLEQGYSPNLPTLSAIGYREIIAYVLGEITLEQAVALIKRKTRTFVRRQANWFKQQDQEIRWFLTIPDPLDLLESTILTWLKIVPPNDLKK
jgi:tRNA dimethylallyltransferase